MRPFIIFTILFVIVFCGPSFAATIPLPVVASFSILGDMAKEIGGDAITVTTLVGPNGDTHVFDPTPKHLKQIAASKLVIKNGLGFDVWMDRAINATGYKGDVVTASTGVAAHQMTDDGQTITDPHAWQDLSNGVVYVQNISAALIKALPEHAADIAAHANALIAKIKTKDSEIKAAFAKIPADRRVVITSHDAFGYFGSAYGIKFLAPEGLSTASEPSAKQIRHIIEQMKVLHIKTLFLENMASPRFVEQLAREGNAKIGGTLYADALSAATGDAPTYLDMFNNNVPKLVAAMME